MRRRQFLKATSVGGLSGIAGCPTDGTVPNPAHETDGFIDLPWTQLPGPPGGPVTDIAVAEADPDWIYASTETAGMYVSSDRGSHWIQGLERMHHRGRVSVSPHDPEVAYGQERTSDGGRHWYDHNHPSRHRFPPVDGVLDLVWNPFDADTIYAATAEGFFRTVNDGRDWERRPLPGNDSAVTVIEAHPADAGVVFASVFSEGVAMSADRGQTWSLVPGSDALPDQRFRGLRIGDPATDDLYVALNAFGVYRLADGALNKLTDDLVIPWWTNQLQLTSDGSRLYFIGGQAADAGFEGWFDRRQLFELDTTTDGLSTVTLPDKPSAVATHPHDASTIYFGGHQWVWESTDAGETWTPLSNDFFDRYLATVGTNPSHPDTVMPGSICSTGLSVSHDRGETWEWKRSGLDPFHEGEFNEHYLMQIAANGDRAYATTAAGLLISEDNGDTWRLLENEFSGVGPGHGEGSAKHLHGLAVDPDNPNVVYVGTGLGDAGGPRDYFDDVAYIWKTEDGGDTWRRITDGFPTDRDTTIQDIIVSTNDPSVVYIGTNAEDYISGGKRDGAGSGLGVFKSKDAGGRWERLQTPFRNVHSLTQDAEVAQTIYASSPDGVYRSADGGTSWDRVLREETLALLAHPEEPDVIFAGTRTDRHYWDVFVSSNGGQTWASGNLTIQVGVKADDREYDAAEPHSDYATERGQIMWFSFDRSNSLLYAATQGTGLWRVDTSPVE